MAGNSVLIIADARFPAEIKKNLEAVGSLVPFSTQGIVYDAISGHPDIFLCQTPTSLVAGPNTPETILLVLRKAEINLVMGEEPVGRVYPASARYNAFVGEDCLIHH
ncbi:MAG TPA: hypothetical protein VLH37_09355, partial [Bacteroidales bacterium]|nr:hypothetical protein [Bacteroidales bacterium]